MKRVIHTLALLLTFVLLASGLAGCGDLSAADAAAVSSAVSVYEAVSVDESESEEAESQDESESEQAEAQSESDAGEERFSVSAGSDAEQTESNEETEAIAEEGTYTAKEEVALYLHLYGHLPDNYLTKKEAEKLGWDSSAGNLQDVAPGMSIGGSRFGNYEGLLPEADGRQYYECDIDYEGGYRNAKRIIYSNDGLVFYTEDHYASFEQLY
ncbi:MAG: ribonuclease domain-containing protein [Lachnospiraceae bacterium]|nr:ribonuclease domain-containing protein [Lachnospiraceae bacterium]